MVQCILCYRKQLGFDSSSKAFWGLAAWLICDPKLTVGMWVCVAVYPHGLALWFPQKWASTRWIIYPRYSWTRKLEQFCLPHEAQNWLRSLTGSCPTPLWGQHLWCECKRIAMKCLAPRSGQHLICESTQVRFRTLTLPVLCDWFYLTSCWYSS